MGNTMKDLGIDWAVGLCIKPVGCLSHSGKQQWEHAKTSKELKPLERELKTECPSKMWIKTMDQAMVQKIAQQTAYSCSLLSSGDLRLQSYMA